jgi:hypothetical protein
MTILPMNHNAALFIQAPKKVVCDTWLAWVKSIPFTTFATCEMATFTSLQSVFDVLDKPRKAIPDMAVVMATQSDWTVYLDNDLLQNMPQSVAYVLANKLRSSTIFSCYGEVDAMFYLTKSDGMKTVERSVAVSKEGRWLFRQSGERLAFEQVDAYLSKNIRDRLTQDMLLRYLASFGINSKDDKFYSFKDSAILRFRDH